MTREQGMKEGKQKTGGRNLTPPPPQPTTPPPAQTVKQSKYLEYKNKLKQAPPTDPYLDAILRVIMDFEDRVEEDNVLMVGVMDIERLIELVERNRKTNISREEVYVGGKLYCHYEHCGNCAYTLYESTDSHFDYCPKCGNRIDWK